jgi:acetolactate synthase-1/2/3 large subunit
MGTGRSVSIAAEIDTAVRYDLPFLAIVGNERAGNAEYQIQVREYGERARRAASSCPALRPRSEAFRRPWRVVTLADECCSAEARARVESPAASTSMIEATPRVPEPDSSPVPRP